MNKKLAKEMAYEGNVTFGHLQELIENSDYTKPCKLNKNITRKMCLDIMTSGIEGRDPSEKPKTTRYNMRDKLTLTGDGINVMNILYECS